jgi:hypothetical protein
MNCMARITYKRRDDGFIPISSIKNLGCGSLHISDCDTFRGLTPSDVAWRVVVKDRSTIVEAP